MPCSIPARLSNTDPVVRVNILPVRCAISWQTIVQLATRFVALRGSLAARIIKKFGTPQSCSGGQLVTYKAGYNISRDNS